MAPLHVVVRDGGTDRLWRAGRATALIALVAVFAGLVLAPDAGLAVLWGGFVPAIATSLFVTPVLWRGICPLATLNEVGNGIGRPVTPSPRTQTILGIGGLVLFHILVPARLLLFNHNGTAVVAAGLAIGMLAILLGARFAVRSAFCNALCPILPMERLYGQAPIMSVERGRCGACTVCTPRGCLDLSGAKNLAQIIGPSRRTRGWLFTPFGLFASALPGFILGYFLAPAGVGGSAVRVYGMTLGGSVASLLVVQLAVRTLSLAMDRALLLLAAWSGVTYFAFTGPAIARLWHLPASAGMALGLAGVVFVAGWLVRAVRPLHPSAAL